jgi:hypothetical protein
MAKPTINYAINTLNELVDALKAGYWDSTEIACKDRVFDLYSVINTELTELAKLSVDDLDLEFEPMTENFIGACKKFGLLSQNIDTWFARTETEAMLRKALAPAALLISDECRI